MTNAKKSKSDKHDDKSRKSTQVESPDKKGAAKDPSGHVWRINENTVPAGGE